MYPFFGAEIPLDTTDCNVRLAMTKTAHSLGKSLEPRRSMDLR